MKTKERRSAGRAAVACTVAVMGSLALFVWQAVKNDRRAELGRELFSGEPSRELPLLRGRLAGHETQLPAVATRCMNCHATSTTAGAIGTPLRRDTLQRALPRRGGPPSAYDQSSLCRLLRDGIDPAFVVVNQAMPRFDVTNLQCAALWAWLNRM
jgi:hypothetical protein